MRPSYQRRAMIPEPNAGDDCWQILEDAEEIRQDVQECLDICEDISVEDLERLMNTLSHANEASKIAREYLGLMP